MSNAKNTNEIDINIGAKINELRLSLGVTRQELAGKIGITHQQLQKYEHGVNRVTVSRLFDIAKAIDIPINVFLENVEDSSENNSNHIKQRMCAEVMKDFLKISKSSQQDAVRRLIKELAI